jgi:hypothetical protein
MTTYAYSPATGELINTTAPASWMGTTQAAPPAFDPQAFGCFWNGTAWVLTPSIIGPTPAKQWATYQASAQAALDATDITVHRVIEAVALGKTTLTTTDVVAFMQYRSSLRAILSEAQPATIPIALPPKPAYPANT